METLHTRRLTLLSLTLADLQTGLISLNQLSGSVGIPVAASLFDGVVERAVRMKIEKMDRAAPELHPWFTYWMIIINDENIGAGMVGFKGNPDSAGKAEIGYGIDPIFQSRGYMTEAVRAMIAWAFSHQECCAVTATSVLAGNLASQKVLLRNGFSETGHNEDGVHFELTRQNWQKQPIDNLV
jgi:predicted acetyltransferase